MRIGKKSTFSLTRTIEAHGWYSLDPFAYNEKVNRLSYSFELEGCPVDITLSETPAAIEIEASYAADVSKAAVVSVVRHMLRIDEDFERFHGLVGGDPVFSWIKDRKMGPMLRSATVFEDLVKTICTTNCNWSLTKTMIGNLVSKLGKETPSGRRTFPGPAMMAGKETGFYTDEIRAGYRGPYLLELAEKTASGEVDPESWLKTDLPTAELKKEIKKIKGVGDYAADHILKLVGRYDGLALDSFLRSCFYESRNGGKPCADKKIEKHYQAFDSWKGLVMWFDMVEERRKMREAMAVAGA